jgi:SulP family sulfate permease
MTGLAAILILAGFETINTERIELVRDTSLSALAAMGITFLATLVLPIQAAVFLGVVVSCVLYLYQASATVRLMEIVPVPHGLPEERPAPAELPSNQITILNPYGSLFFAGARMFEAQLPAADQATRAVVILRLRAQIEVGSTLLNALTRYAETLQQNGGLLMIAGVSEHVLEQLERTEMFEVIGAENVFPATSRLGEAVNNALTAAHAWLGTTPPS